MLSPKHKTLTGVPFNPIRPQDLDQAVPLSDPSKLGFLVIPAPLCLETAPLLLPLWWSAQLCVWLKARAGRTALSAASWKGKQTQRGLCAGAELSSRSTSTGEEGGVEGGGRGRQQFAGSRGDGSLLGSSLPWQLTPQVLLLRWG